jgi:hypothetical protein
MCMARLILDDNLNSFFKSIERIIPDLYQCYQFDLGLKEAGERSIEYYLIHTHGLEKAAIRFCLTVTKILFLAPIKRDRYSLPF